MPVRLNPDEKGDKDGVHFHAPRISHLRRMPVRLNPNEKGDKGGVHLHLPGISHLRMMPVRPRPMRRGTKAVSTFMFLGSTMAITMRSRRADPKIWSIARFNV